MSMSKQDFIALAATIRDPRFNRERWLAYIAGTCGPNGGAVKGGAKW